MKPAASSYVGSAIGGTALFLLLALSAYVTGYLLLPNKNGLYQGEWQFKLFKPAMHVQRWITCREVSSGYIDSAEIHHSMSLPYPPLHTSRLRPVPIPISGNAPPGMPTESPRVATQSLTPRMK